MPQYRYKAFTQAGALRPGEIEATDLDAAIGTLSEKGLIPFDVSPVAQASAQPWWNRDILAGPGRRMPSTATLTRELATLIGAHVPIYEALRIIAAEGSERRIRTTAQRALQEILRGASLSTALMAADPTLPPYYLSMVQAGEASGTLHTLLAELATLLERSVEIRTRLTSMLIYPMLLLAVAVAAIVLVLTILIPTIAPLLKGAGTELPTLIKLLLSIRDFLSSFWLFLLFAVPAAALVSIKALQGKKARFRFSRRLLLAPGVGRVLAKVETARLDRLLAALLRGGVTLVPALEIAKGATANAAFAKALVDVLDMVKQGRPLAEALTETGVFPALSLRLIAVGEETGRLEEMLDHVAKIFEAQVHRNVERLMSLITPVFTLAIGVSVGALMLSVMTAILSVNDIALK
ncbi:MAG: type II secretion system F family protein [Hyphomicrobiaceae bacterium]|nr:MAG: type II secretion system F family protein [Hyphomicrobiaceae bacterium]